MSKRYGKKTLETLETLDWISEWSYDGNEVLVTVPFDQSERTGKGEVGSNQHIYIVNFADGSRVIFDIKKNKKSFQSIETIEKIKKIQNILAS